MIAAAVLLALGLARFEIDGGLGAVLAQAVIVLLLVLAYEAIPEELIFRGLLFSVLRRRLRPWLTVIVQAACFCLFGLAIGAAQNAERLLLFAVFSLALGTIRALTGSVYATIGFHAVFQVITQTVNGPQWSAVDLVDPELWMRDVAFFLAPLVLGPVLVWLVLRRRSNELRPTS